MKLTLSRPSILWSLFVLLQLCRVDSILNAAPPVNLPENDRDDRVAKVSVEELAATKTPEVSEKPPFPATQGTPRESSLFGGFGSSMQQQQGALSGKIVFMNSGHGWTFDPTYWRLQRGVLNEMNEDYGNLDQLNFFAQYCFNAG